MTFMKAALVLVVLAASSVNADWDCSTRCPGYNACVQQNKNSRLLLNAPDDPSIIEDIHGNATWPIHHPTKDSTIMSSSSNLRGSDMHARRQLELLLTFQLQLFWEEGACWQEEWREREWCLQCKGGSCKEDDYLILEECSGSSRQRFIYRPVANSGGGKFMPVTRPDLCWTRTRVNAHQLKKCGARKYTDDEGFDVQIIVGFDPFEASELHPNKQPHKCMDNHHHPKAEELIRAGKCDEARRNKTNKWKAINKSTVDLDASSPPIETVPSARIEQDGDLPRVQALGPEYCDKHTCGMCQGDCDRDSQCEGDLKCFQRGPNEPVPGCSGGHESPSKTDYCYDPSFARVETAGDQGEDPEVNALGSNYCTKDNKCGLCEGDCDDDDDCADGLICHQRGKNDDVPGCRGGHNDSSKTDYCIKE